MKQRVTVIDYGVGNLLSVARAIEAGGAEAEITDSADAVLAAERLVLPGVGAFGDGMRALAELDLVEAIKAYAAGGRPLLGICLGMQMLLECSEEFGSHSGLALIPGRVIAVPPTAADGVPHPIPHIGWNALVPAEAGTKWDGTVLDGLAADCTAYFVHSFMAEPDDPAHRLADCRYDGRRIAAVIGRGNIVGCQFHPEKSAAAGLRIIGNFLGVA